MAKMVDESEDMVTIRAVSRDEEGRKRVEKVEVATHDVDTLKHIEKKLQSKGVHRMDRHPAGRVGGMHKPPPKAGHGGKYTWEGPDDAVTNELEAPVALDEGDPNYVDEEEEKDGGDEAADRVVGAVEVAKAAEARVDVVTPPGISSTESYQLFCDLNSLFCVLDCICMSEK